MGKLVLTPDTVRALKAPAAGNRIDYDVPGKRASDYVRGFAVRTTAAGTKAFLFCYVTADGVERRQKIGDVGAWTVTTARDEARRLRTRVDAGHDPAAEKQAKRAATAAKRSQAGVTFGGLMTAYCDALERARKPSAAGVRRELRTTIERAHPKLWKLPAADVTLDDLTAALRTLTRAGKWRQAEKTRSYLRAAYSAAAGSKGNTATADLFSDFARLPNLGRDLAPIERPKLVDDADPDAPKRALSEDELRAYWRRIAALDGATGALLRFHLLTGAQRCAQLARLTHRNVDKAAATMLLLDGKGRRKQARPHVVPLLPEALQALDVMKGDAGPYAFSLDGGASGAGFHQVRRKVLEVAQAMVDAGETAELFTPGELRITVETRLQALGVSSEIRAHLQSHGLGGVQNKHYAKHDFAAEKRAALETLRALCDLPGKNVTPIRRKRAG
jgi:integrase